AVARARDGVRSGEAQETSARVAAAGRSGCKAGGRRGGRPSPAGGGGRPRVSPLRLQRSLPRSRGRVGVGAPRSTPGRKGTAPAGAVPGTTLDAPGLLRARPRRVGRGLEGLAFVPVRPLVAVGQGPADLVQQLQVLDHAVPAPAVVDLVAGLVVAAGILVRGRLAGRGAALEQVATA